MQTTEMRERLFTMRMSDEEYERLELVAKHYALNAAGVLRMLVKREADSLLAATPAAPRKPTKSTKR